MGMATGSTFKERLAALAAHPRLERPLVMLGIAIMVLGTLPEVSGPYALILTGICLAISVAFAILYAARIWSAEHRETAVRSPAAIVDLLAAAPIPLALAVGVSAADARLLGILWALKLIRQNPAFALVLRVLRSERQPLLSVATAFLVITLFASTLAYLAERQAQPEAFNSIPAALWWTVTTITTTGYGDKTPISFFGRVVGGSVMIAGIGLFALWAGILASSFSAELKRRDFLESWDVVVRLPLFRGLGSAALAEIARLLKVENFAAEAPIVRAGQPGDSMYFIAEGEVAVLVGDQRIILKAGQFFGEAALIASAPRNATVVAAGRARLLRLDVVEFRDLASRLPELLAIIHSEDSRRKPGEE